MSPAAEISRFKSPQGKLHCPFYHTTEPGLLLLIVPTFDVGPFSLLQHASYQAIDVVRLRIRRNVFYLWL